MSTVYHIPSHKKVQRLVSAEAHSFETTTLEAVRPWRRKDDGHRGCQVLRDIALGQGQGKQ